VEPRHAPDGPVKDGFGDVAVAVRAVHAADQCCEVEQPDPIHVLWTTPTEDGYHVSLMSHPDGTPSPGQRQESLET